ncbi:GNAT family N-acetyltransferase [Carboxylicivirga sp. N1Y90]|uniref:GNAT family N-acetyltransferase n=1 Tax=Carboxylicivirga fragile TaxID=3417571 RepID=UPI003D3540D7|nr:GNAT family N-acetyltransferase [Marinilabiliaceae bacterium N1Y90]
MDYPIIKTERLTLRQITFDDSAAVFAYRSDTVSNRYQGWIPKTKDDTEDWIDKIASSFNQADSWAQFAIILNSSGELIGDIGLHFLDEHQVELGCTLAKTNQGQGYATEALSSCIKYLFKSLYKHRIITSIDPRNTASINLVKRLGFRQEAHFKQSILQNDQWLDDLVFALLKSEYNSY